MWLLDNKETYQIWEVISDKCSKVASHTASFIINREYGALRKKSEDIEFISEFWNKRFKSLSLSSFSRLLPLGQALSC